MTKLEFILTLNDKLSGLPKEERENRLSFYSEMIEDRVEEGISEESAVSEIGSVDEIAEQIISDTPLTKIAKETLTKNRNLKIWEIVLIAVGSPIWFSLLIAAASVLFSIYVSLWSVIISIWAVFISITACAFAGLAAGIFFAITTTVVKGIAVIGASMICAGLSVLFYLGCKTSTKGLICLSKSIGLLIKKSFLKRSEHNV